jgi:hypothetical protein
LYGGQSVYIVELLVYGLLFELSSCRYRAFYLFLAANTLLNAVFSPGDVDRAEDAYNQAMGGSHGVEEEEE